MKRFVVLLCSLAVLAAACGSDADPTADPADDPAASTTSTAPSPTTTPAAEPGDLDVVVDRAEPSPTAPIEPLVGSLNGVGWDLWASHPGLAGDANAVISPLSIGHALLMARDAGDETTIAAINEALGLPEGLSAHEAWNALDLAMRAAADAEDRLTLEIADRIWPDFSTTPSDDWVDLLGRYHGATPVPLDLQGASEESRQVINQWVSDRTHELIPELLPEGFIDPTTVLVLTDAIYLEADWATTFGKYGPVSGPFTRLDGSTVDVEFMQELELGSRRGAGDGFVGAEIPYVGGDFSMLVVVPEEGRFEEVESRLGADLLAEIDGSFTTGPFELLLPKWDDEVEQLDLIDWLRSFGAAPGFYPGISDAAMLQSAVHGANIAVDEVGTVAAAATAFGFNESGPPEPELTVAADKPFLYMIRHVDSRAVLFLGKVTDPTA